MIRHASAGACNPYGENRLGRDLTSQPRLLNCGGGLPVRAQCALRNRVAIRWVA